MTIPTAWTISPVRAASAVSDAGQAAVCGFEATFPAADLCVRQARQLTAAHLRDWGTADELIDKGVLVVSELVTNAVRHGRAHLVGLMVLSSGVELYIEVSDGNSVPARLRSAGRWDEHGRGLFLVNAMARAWGVSRDGTRTWCSIAIPEGGRDGRIDG